MDTLSCSASDQGNSALLVFEMVGFFPGGADFQTFLSWFVETAGPLRALRAACDPRFQSSFGRI